MLKGQINIEDLWNYKWELKKKDDSGSRSRLMTSSGWL
jgi:hypothetical protein